MIEKEIKGEQEGKDQTYFKFGKNDDWENFSEIEKIMRLKKKKKGGRGVSGPGQEKNKTQPLSSQS